MCAAKAEEVVVRLEREEDRAVVEDITRRAFYNLYMPGCVEHYLVHIMRSHPDFIPELDFVAVLGGAVVGNIMFTRSTLTDTASGATKTIATFGPVCIAPEHQRRGLGKRLITHALEQAAARGIEAVVIFGYPSNYVGLGFVNCKKHNVALPDGKYPSSMLVKELVPSALDGRTWAYKDSPVMNVTEKDALAYDDTLPPLERKKLPCQEVFDIMSHSFVE